MLQEYLDRLQLNSAKTTDSLDDVNSTNQVKDINMDENADSFVDESVMEKVLQKRSLRMRNMQRAWQVLFDFLNFPFGYCIWYHMCLEWNSNDQECVTVGLFFVIC